MLLRLRRPLEFPFVVRRIIIVQYTSSVRAYDSNGSRWRGESDNKKTETLTTFFRIPYYTTYIRTCTFAWDYTTQLSIKRSHLVSLVTSHGTFVDIVVLRILIRHDQWRRCCLC